jgi:hypothetical protein
MQTADISEPAEASRVAVRLLLLWAEQPAVWFTQAEAQFTLAGISSKQTKFCYVISQLDDRYAAEVENIITSLPEQDPYSMLRAKLVRWLSPSRGKQCAKRIPPLTSTNSNTKFTSQLI